jgi:hypothetical protein
MADAKIPNIDRIPNFDFERALAELSRALKDVAYVAVGLGVIGFQRAQVRRVELTKQIEAQLGDLQAEVSKLSAPDLLSDLRAGASKLSAPDLPDGAAVRGQLTVLARSVDDSVAPVRQQFEDQLDRLEEVLPPAARDFVQTVRSTAAAQEQAIRNSVGLS